ncbi:MULTISPECIES: P-loop domain-containing protein [unclassified Methanoregula]|uniref:P-loop domain-containing protein n=1 Tax=unclassified Methanoregula TaxID=2649730 RepID=UPI0009CE486B|nr:MULTISPECIES: P-loop domain-containing protein [unclassified Methanoregula]OPX62512.1 MAG: putative ATPase of the ABC class [Methanoregula sp. PtaB.Bin085]OPY31611.1 MAG: putative ATPase of the ABC class [Methanoregula sp. PtaU1.Bin006]
MAPEDRESAFRSFLSAWTGEGAAIDTSSILHGTTTFIVRSFDREALQFSFPLLVRRNLLHETGLDPAGSDGAVAALIERVKEQAQRTPEFGPLYGSGVAGSLRYRDTIEPYTVIHSDEAIGTALWKADARNFCDRSGVHLIIRGALPCPQGSSGSDTEVERLLADLAQGVSDSIQNAPLLPLRAAWIASLDQKMLRQQLPALGLVSFVGDGSHLARSFTQHRPFFRVAGPRDGVSIPFACPADLGPVEVELPASGRTVTGLGIRMKEVFAVAGSNAQGKTTFLEGILAGMDDHLPHDGRERVVTVRGACTAESTNMGLAGADISMFFHALPPGVSGTVKGAFGAGSGSMSMAHQMQTAIARRSPLLIIDEDRAAPNLLVRSCLQKEEITPLAEILARQREMMGDTALVFAACAMDTLIAQADRIMVLDRHVALAIEPAEFRRQVAALLRKTAGEME